MGVLTRGEIITEGLLRAGKEPGTLATRAATMLNARIRSLEKGAPWAWLLKRREGLALGTGVTSLSIGAGAGGVSNEIKIIRSPILVYAAAYNTRVLATIEQLQGNFADLGYDPASNRGVPYCFRVRMDATTWGKWVLLPNPIPDRDLLLGIDYQELSPAMTDDAEIPRYPNDQTLIQAVALDAWIHMYGPDSPEAQAASDDFSALAARDRAEFGIVPGINDELGLDPATFRRRGGA